MMAVVLSFIALLAYFCGSISTPILDSHLVFHTNLLKYSRDNLGLTRFEKRFGKKGYLYIFLTEAIKTAVPILIGWLLMLIFDHGDIGRALALFCVVLGTNFPIMYEFKGEHSLIAVTVGLWFISGSVAIVWIVVFLACYFISHYISLSCVISALFMCLITAMMIDEVLVQRLMYLTALLIIIEYRKNVVGILKGTESKFRYRKDAIAIFDDL